MSRGYPSGEGVGDLLPTPVDPGPAGAGVATVMQLQAYTDGAQLCALGHHAWMPWLPIVTDDGAVTHYVTFCVRCRHHEQYDL